MNRSHINAKIRDAEAFFAEYRFALPPWAVWRPEDWYAHRGGATEAIGRFPTVEEDEPPYRYLASDYAHAFR